MGTSRRPRPARLADKLLQIRIGLGLSQNQMIAKLGAVAAELQATHISRYESGKREPPLQILLEYARAARVPVELIIDDKRELPARLPPDSEWVLKKGRLWQQKAGSRKQDS